MNEIGDMTFDTLRRWTAAYNVIEHERAQGLLQAAALLSVTSSGGGAVTKSVDDVLIPTAANPITQG